MRRLLTSLWQWATKPMPAAETMPPRPIRLALPPMTALDWTQRERDDWRMFLATPTGQVLIQRICAMEYLTLLKAAEGNDAQAVQRAAGYGDLRRYLESLLQAGAPVSAPNDTERPAGESHIRERLTP